MSLFYEDIWTVILHHVLSVPEYIPDHTFLDTIRNKKDFDLEINNRHTLVRTVCKEWNNIVINKLSIPYLRVKSKINEAGDLILWTSLKHIECINPVFIQSKNTKWSKMSKNTKYLIANSNLRMCEDVKLRRDNKSLKLIGFMNYHHLIKEFVDAVYKADDIPRLVTLDLKIREKYAKYVPNNLRSKLFLNYMLPETFYFFMKQIVKEQLDNNHKIWKHEARNTWSYLRNLDIKKFHDLMNQDVVWN